MTEKEKAQLYNEAIKRAKKFYGNGIIEIIFPELKESENGEIKNAIFNHLKKVRENCQDDVCGVHAEDTIDWLEKQGESDNNPNSQTIAEYLYKEKDYPDSLNRYKYIPTFKEIIKDVQIYNNYKKNEWIEKACDWLRKQKEMIGISFQEDFIERFKMAMKK